MKTGHILILGALGLLLLGAFRRKQQIPGVTEPGDQQGSENPGSSNWITYSPYSSQAGHPMAGMVPLFVKRYYTEKHLNSPFTSVNIRENGLPPFVSAFTNMKDRVPVAIFEEAEYQDGRTICRITDFKEQAIPDDQIVKFLQYPDKYAKLYFDNNGIALPLAETPKTTPFNLNIWVLKEHLKNAPLAYLPGEPAILNGNKRSI